MNLIGSNTNDFLNNNVKVLKSRVSKTAYQGIVVAVAALIIATLSASYYTTGSISIDGIALVQKTNIALWIMDAVPFVFAFWGQYSSTILAYEASALVIDQTQELRERADSFEKQARYNVTHDLLTDLPNKELFYDRVEQGILSQTSQQQSLSVLLIEIGNYKQVSDTLGRNASDSLIKQVSVRLKSAYASPATIARIDSNIFSLLLTNIENKQTVLSQAENIHRALEEPFFVEKVKMACQANIGIVYFPDHGGDVDTLVQRAGIALYVAQNSNKGYALYDPSYDEHTPRQLTLMSELNQAVERGELELYYQPKLDLRDDCVSSAEALVRWNHPRHGLLLPDHFVPLMERTRMIQSLTRWVIEASMLQAVKWAGTGYNISISVNLSAKDLNNPELPDLIAGLKGRTGVNPEWIMLEITESSIMSNPETAFEIINRIDQMGFRFSIDDYGTGYSSLSYLKRMPLKELKIDRSFVKDIMTDESDAVIVNATINLAHNLGLQVTAEGVNDPAVLQKLRREGCDVVQGYLLARPMPVGAFEEWLSSEANQFKEVVTE
ncbi:putative bifunctional diguanylate cyclase/phosphodiesterase [Aliamphritea hakodatensis]|uniref:putative bifunctional diguanylate cyclase/phosphodiesterase n=1 Tax=Aliamphritea hakodatensis TaxID=2895352 RepID=UPI0022FD9D53|nr:GGDEF domain-containing phosphodiesterase [Aliamphritea hakodatensis]